MTSETKVPEYEGWAVVEIMGHKSVAGYVREAAMFGTAMLRVDVPGKDGTTQATQYFSGGALYCVTPCTEEIARAMNRFDAPAATAYALPAPKRCDSEFYTPCSNDFEPDPEHEGDTICGRHLLQREAHELATSEPGEDPDHPF